MFFIVAESNGQLTDDHIQSTIATVEKHKRVIDGKKLCNNNRLANGYSALVN